MAIRVIALLLGILVVLPSPKARASSSLDGISRIQLKSGSYIRVADWAKAINFKTRWVKTGRTLEATSKWSKLSLEIGSSKATLNGVRLWLSKPVVVHKGKSCISALDLEKQIMPVLYPPKLSGKTKVTTVCLDPGHGGNDPGNQQGKYSEEKLTLQLAQDVKKRLEAAGLKVVMTRSTDKYVNLNLRPSMAQQAKADLFVSLHYNSAGGAGRSAQGPEIYCLTPVGATSTNAGGRGTTSVAYPGNKQDERNMLIAYQIQKRLAGSNTKLDRGVKRARFAVLRYASMPAVLVEAGFMSNSTDLKRIVSSSKRAATAKAIADGIIAYKKIVERGES